MRAVLLALLLAGTASASEPHVLATSINGVVVEQGAVFDAEGQTWAATPAVWSALGLRLSHAEQQSPFLTSQALGLTFQYDEDNQAINFDVPASRLPTQTLGAARSLPALSPAAPGVLINYSVAGQVTPDTQALSVGHDVRTSGAWGTLRTTGQLNWTNRGGVDYRRGLTQWSKNDYDRQITYQVGDVVASGATHPMLGGVRITKDPSLDPYTPTWPVPTLGGVALDPMTVEILANQSKVAEHEVGRGGYQIERFPLQAGRNALDVVVRDEFGRQQVVSSAYFYFTPTLLRRGLTTWSVAAGNVRQGSDSRYGTLGASFEVAHGVSDRWTITGSAQGSADGHNVTAGVRTVLGRAGTVALDVGQSESDKGSGRYVRGQYSYQDQRFGVSLTHERSDNWWTLANQDSTQLLARSRTQAAVTWQNDDRSLRGKLGFTDVQTLHRRTRFVEAGLAWQRGPHRVSGVAMYDLERHAPTLAASYRYAFGTASVYATARSAPDVDRLTLGGTARTTLAGQRLSVRGELVQSNNDTTARVNSQLLTPKGTAVLDLEAGEQGTRVSGSWSGSVHLGKGGATFADTISDGYAVVDIPGVEGVTVRANGRPIGKTNKAGRVVVPHLPALSPSTIKVDSKTLPPGVNLESSQIEVAPALGTGALGQFKVLGFDARAFTLHRATPIESGASATTSEESTLVGFGGVLYLERPQPGMVVTIEDTQGTCVAQVPTPLPAVEDTTALECE